MLTASVLVLASLAPAAPVPLQPAPNPTGRAFLGVESQDPLNYSLVVGRTLPDFPAEKAGIRPGDRLVRVGTCEPVDFKQLSAHVQTYRPGATIEVEVDRNGKRERFHVRLAPRPESADAGRTFPPFPGSPND